MVALTVAALTPGCLSNDSADEGRGGTNLYLADEDGLRPAPNLPGVVLESMPTETRYKIDFMSLVEPDSVVLFLLQALQDQTVHVDVNQSFEFQRESPASVSESQRTGDFCVFGMNEAYVPGDAYLQRALGASAAMEETGYDRRFIWELMHGDRRLFLGSVGTIGGSGLAALMEAGDWLLLAAGQSGLEPLDFNDGQNTWTMEVAADAESRLIKIPAARFLCGLGLARFGGSGAPLVHAGGALSAEDRYGSTAVFASDALLPLNLLRNEATMRFQNDEVPLHDLSKEWRFAYQPAPAAIEVASWVGEPEWLLAGLSIPVPAPGCPWACPPV